MEDLIKLKVDGLIIPSNFIKEYKVAYNKIDGEGTKRNLQGTMRRQVIANKVKLSVTLVENLTIEQTKPIMEKITKDTMSVEYYDIKTGTTKLIDAYINAPEPSIYARLGQSIRLNSLSFNIIEL